MKQKMETTKTSNERIKDDLNVLANLLVNDNNISAFYLTLSYKDKNHAIHSIRFNRGFNFLELFGILQKTTFDIENQNEEDIETRRIVYVDDKTEKE